MKTVIMIDGGAGRVISSIPSLLKFSRLNPNNDFKVVLPAWEELLYGIPELQNRVFNSESKGIFDSVFKDADKILSPEPYRHPDYINQKISLTKAFDLIINKSNDEELSAPILKTTKAEQIWARKFIFDVKKTTNKNKVIVFQPFGRDATVVSYDENTKLAVEIFDSTYRSFNCNDYLNLVKKLSEEYAIVFFGEKNLYIAGDDYSIKLENPLRNWISIIEQADYFIGIDSVGQHIARAVNTQGIVIFGSTFPINTSYPEFFHILENSGNKKYVPIRISENECKLINVFNQSITDFSKDLEEMYNIIINDIEIKTGNNTLSNKNVLKEIDTGIRF